MQRNICPYCQRPSYTSEGRGRVTLCPYCGAYFLTGFDDERGRPAPGAPANHPHDPQKARENL